MKNEKRGCVGESACSAERMASRFGIENTRVEEKSPPVDVAGASFAQSADAMLKAQ